jgi:hypothetical protein
VVGAAGRFAHIVKCARVVRGKLVATTPAEFHPRSHRRPRLTFEVPRPRSTSLEAGGRFAHIVKCARILRPVKLAPQSNRISSMVLFSSKLNLVPNVRVARDTAGT